jgi:hypothetical protein
LFNLTWMTRATPAGRSISALRASEPLTEGSVCIGWPTAQARDWKGPQGRSYKQEAIDLPAAAAAAAACPTPRAEDAESSGMRHSRGVEDTMTAVASLTAWKTPCVPNGGRGPHLDGKTKDQIGLENEAKLGAWPTPMAGTPAQKGNNEAGNTDSGRKTVEMCQWPVDPLTDSGETTIGYLLGPNGWENVPASGQLNAGHSRWLMGLPRVWDDCGVTAMASLRKRRKRL